MTADFYQLIHGKKILVTGGTGSIGSVIVRELLAFEPQVIRIFSRDTVKQLELQRVLVADEKRLRFILGDLRDKERLLSAAENVDLIFHAGAFKYVPQGEYNPFEAIQTNVLGTQNLITAALQTPTVSHMVMISTDKAVAPTSTMGASKLLAERLMTAAHYIRGSKKIIFVSVRFGNVLGTVGSVIPIFRELAGRGETLTITDPRMTRFFMTIPDAVGLVLNATLRARGGEIFVLKMPALQIADLAAICATRYASPPVRVTIGAIRPGEKIHEALLTEDEARTALETDRHFIIVPQISVGDIAFNEYSYEGAHPIASHTYRTDALAPLSGGEITALLDRAGL
jgi:FlaA1/EpsC-like NDP-sugar epimerase